MVCPAGRVKASFQPLRAAEPVLVMVMFSVSPVFQALTELLTLQAPVGGDVGGGDVGGVVSARPMNCRASMAIPLLRMLCVPPATLTPSTGALGPVPP